MKYVYIYTYIRIYIHIFMYIYLLTDIHIHRYIYINANAYKFVHLSAGSSFGKLSESAGNSAAYISDMPCLPQKLGGGNKIRF